MRALVVVQIRAPRPSGSRKVSAIAPDTDDRPINEGDLVRAMLREYKNKLREEEVSKPSSF